MTNPFGPDTDLVASLRLIAGTLVPVLEAFREELGRDRADAIAARGLAAWRQGLAESARERVVGAPRDCWEKATAEALEAAGDVVDVAELAEGAEGLRFAVTRCRVAELFRAIGEPALGFELACAQDLAQLEALGRGEVALERRATLMEGAPACDFHYRFAATAASK